MLRGFKILLVFLALSSFLYSQEKESPGGYARVFSLGGSPFIHDIDNIKINPAYGGIYKNVLWGDIGGDNPAPTYKSNGQFLGVNFVYNDDLTLGVILQREDYMTPYAITAIDPHGIGNYSSNFKGMNNNFEIMSSYKFGRSIFGIGLAYAGAGSKSTPATGTGNEANSSQLGINLGAITQLGNNIVLDGSISLMLPSYDYKSSVTDIKISQTIVNFDMRSFIKLNDKFTIVPKVYFDIASGEYEVSGLKTDLSEKMEYGVGIGLNYKAGDFMFTGGPTLEVYSTTIPEVVGISPELTGTDIGFPVWNIGAEWNAAKWLVARIGYTGGSYSYTYESPAGVSSIHKFEETNYNPYGFRFGLGFKFDAFCLDVTLNENVLRDGFKNFNNPKPTFGYLSMSYSF